MDEHVVFHTNSTASAYLRKEVGTKLILYRIKRHSGYTLAKPSTHQISLASTAPFVVKLTFKYDARICCGTHIGYMCVYVVPK